jgi:solute carrier family 35 protein E1
MSRMASVASAASNILGGMRMERKASDTEFGYDSVSTGHSGLGHGRRRSMSESIVHTLPSVSTVRFVFLCTLWYASSAVSSNTGKVILNNFRFPVTLTIVQFLFVASLTWLGSRRELNWTARLRKPTRQILLHTLPMAAFQVGGHIFGSLAISRVPVSTVHTIKVSELNSLN